ncbi:hypothetical protein KQY30_02090 [Streptomyces sp. GMY02]|uniref:hypothetical protein n=1 Tax=Streptomyces sp. GMY02 TaxID=1333528 RepID=UPI001C2C34F8|nr:hypothetical protein [Streptomyces sp. GMY02]QXE33262.1 hypothetical protein KQY30_02090 [Streptomyces sp. GMY02]
MSANVKQSPGVDESPGPGRHPGLLWDVVPPIVAYVLLLMLGAPTWAQLASGIVISLARLAWVSARQRRVTLRPVLMVLYFIAIAVLVAATGNAWLFLLKPSIGQVFLGSLIVSVARSSHRPYTLAIMGRLRRRVGREEILRRYEASAEVRRRHRVMSIAWGVLVISQGVLRGVLLMVLPGAWVAAVSVPTDVTSILVLAVVTVVYLGRAESRVAEPDRADSDGHNEAAPAPESGTPAPT